MNEIKIDRENAYRYMGFREPFSENVDEKTAEAVDKIEQELLKAVKPKFIWRVFDIIRDNGLFLNGCDFELSGNDIKKHLSNCDKAAIVCSTLSADCDKFIAKMSVRGALEMLVSDALASAYIEQISDGAVKDLTEKNEGFSATWVFGAGYGDFPLDILPKLITAVDATRKIGISTTAANTLAPTKSIVGVAGLSRGTTHNAVKSCDNCNMRDKCEFRKNGKRCL